MIEAYTSSSLRKKRERINRFIVIAVITITLIATLANSLLNYKRYEDFLFYIYVGFIIFSLVDLGLFLAHKITVKTAYLLLVYPLFFIVLVPGLNLLFESESKYLAVYAFQAALFCVLYVAICSFLFGGIHPYLITALCITTVIIVVFKYDDPFVENKLAEIVCILAGFVIIQGIYTRLSNKMFKENKTAIRKITKQKKHIEEQAKRLDTAYNELQDTQSLKDSLIESIIHDLKNPLNAILNYSNPPVNASNTVKINESGRQMLMLVENILDVHSMEKTKPEFNIQAVHFNSAAKAAISQVDFLLSQNYITLECNLSDSDYVLADYQIVVRIIVNLLTNAIKYTPQNGTIQISTNYNKENNHLVFHIKDYGPGIPQEYEYRVFEKYTHDDKKKTKALHSSGIGLAFCRLSLEAMDGKIWISDTSEEGTTMSFNLPLSENEEKQKMDISKSVLAESLSHDTKKVLIPFVKELKEQDVYAAGKIMQIISKIDISNDLDTEKWIEEVKKAVFTGNKLRYNELLSIVNNNY